MNFESFVKQQFFLEVWKKGEAGETLNEEETQYYEAMKTHTMYQHIWNAKDIFNVKLKKKEESPFLHITLHVIIENQIKNNKPPETKAAWVHLQDKKKLSSQDAMHSIMVILADEMFDMMKNNKPFNNEKYCSRLKKFLKS